jgi:copper transport protein
MRKFLSILIALFIAIAFIPLGMAQAHSLVPVQAFPGDGAILKQSPAQIRLIFEEEIGEEGSTLQVLNEQNQQVNVTGGVDLNDPGHVTLISDLPELPQGIYLVKWQVSLSDGDSSQGQYYFGIGTVVLPPSPVQSKIAGEPQNLQAAATVKSLAELLLVVTVLLSAASIAIYWIRNVVKQA